MSIEHSNQTMYPRSLIGVFDWCCFGSQWSKDSSGGNLRLIRLCGCAYQFYSCGTHIHYIPVGDWYERTNLFYQMRQEVTWIAQMVDWVVPLLQTGSALARTYLSPFARCTLGMNRHLPAIFSKLYYAITACMTWGFTPRKYWLIEKW